MQTFDVLKFEVVSDDAEIRDIWIMMEKSRLVQRHDKRTLAAAIGQALTRQAFIVKASTGSGRIVSAVIMSQQGTIGNIMQVYGIGVARRIRDEFFEFLKKNGIDEIYGSSDRKDGAISKLFGMERLYTVYKRRL